MIRTLLLTTITFCLSAQLALGGIVYRTTEPLQWGTGKGTPLTHTELDNNFWELYNTQALQTSVFRETQIAAAGQTVFTLVNGTYTPDAGQISVYVNGLRIIPSAYTETDSSTVTFDSGLNLNDEVEFVYVDFDINGSAAQLRIDLASTDSDDGADLVANVKPTITTADYTGASAYARAVAAFAAASTGDWVYVNESFSPTEKIAVTISGLTVEFAPNVTVTATAGTWAETDGVFTFTDVSNTRVIGNGAYIDLNDVAASAVHFTSSDTTVYENNRIENLRSGNHDAPLTTFSTSSGMSPFWADYQKNIRLVDLRVDDYGDGQGTGTIGANSIRVTNSSGVRIVRPHLENGQVGIAVSVSSDVDIENPTIDTFIDNCVYALYTSSDVDIIGGTLEACEEAAVFGSTTAGQVFHNGSVIGTTISNATNIGLTLRYVDGMTIAGNKFVSNNNGIKAGSYLQSGVTVQGNYFEDSAVSAIDLGGAENVVIDGNVIQNTTSTTFPLRVYSNSTEAASGYGNRVTNNVIDASGGVTAAMLLDGSSGTLQDLWVDGNTIRGGIDGAQVNGSGATVRWGDNYLADLTQDEFFVTNSAVVIADALTRTASWDCSSDDCTAGSLALSRVPDNSTITHAWYEVTTAFTCGAGATVAFGIATDDATGLKTATAYDDASYAADAYYAFTPDGAVANFTTKTANERNLVATFASNDCTAGKGRIHYTFSTAE